MVIDYNELDLRYINFSKGMSKFLAESHEQECKKGYVPYSVYCGKLLESLKDKALK